MIVKVCGIKYPDNLMEIVSLSPDAIGLIFYPLSPRYAGDSIMPEDVKKIPSGIIKTGVFVNEKRDVILKIKQQYDLDMIQLHGDEPPAFCGNLSAAGINVMKAFRINDDFDFSRLNAYTSLCTYFLFDAAGRGYGGNGVRFNWQVLGNYKGPTPFILSGGIDADSVSDLRELDHRYLAGVDLNSGFETEPGIKDKQLLDDFIKNFSL